MTKNDQQRMPKQTRGEKAALEAAIAAGPPTLPEDPEQLDLIEDCLGLPETPSLKEYRERKIGRPPGAKNKRTEALATYLLSRYSSPLEVLMQIATRPVEELVAALGCTKIEALQEKRLAAIPCIPYLHQKQPVAIDITNRQVVNLRIVDVPLTDDDAAGNDDGDNTLTLTATVLEKAGDGSNTQSRLEGAGSSGRALHALDEEHDHSKRADRVG
jgi:hypothetical protein